MALSKSQLKYLKKLTHDLKPVIMIGQNGVTENILKELEIALEFHELVKIKIAAANKASCADVIKKITEVSAAETIQAIGKTVTLFRRNSKTPKIELPK